MATRLAVPLLAAGLLLAASVAAVHWGSRHRLHALGVMARARVDGLRTGDLVLFRHRDADPVQQLVTAFSHVGMAVEVGGDVWILETHAAGDVKALGVLSGGVHMYPLRARVRAYEGCVYALRLHPWVALDVANMWRQLPALTGIPFYTRYRDHYMGQCLVNKVCGGCLPPTRRKGMFCSEFVGLLLKVMRAMPPDAPLGCLAPESFVRMPRLYGKPELLSP